GLLALAVALLAVTGLTDNLIPEWLNRWQSLIGSLVGAAGTVFAGWLAFHAVQRQIAHTEPQLGQSQEAAKVAATMALTQPVHAAATTLYVIRLAYAASDAGEDERTQADRVVERSIGQLARALEHFSLKEIARDLDSNNRALYLGILLRLNSFVTIATNPAADMTRDDRLSLQIRTLEGTHEFIALFD